MRNRATRARLLTLLSEACELEHSLSCSYLYAAMSIKKEISEGISAREQQRYRLWASQVFHVAAEEMLHLAQAWNLLTAVGGTPYYARPNFPQPAKHFPLNVALLLRRFDAATLSRFVYYEAPSHGRRDQPDLDLPPGALWLIDESFPYQSVGELYGECQAIIESLDEASLFIGEADRQVGEDLIDFPDLVEVTDRESAVRAIQMVTEQGEGTRAGREDSHYGVFTEIQSALSEMERDTDASRPVADNPFVRRRRDQVTPLRFLYPAPAPGLGGPVVSVPITDRRSIEAVDLFDDAYVAMLQALAYVFSNATEEGDHLGWFARAALELMVTVIRPLGEAICQMPSGTKGVNAGPTFAMTRHAQLPVPPSAARLVFGERLAELASHGRDLAGARKEIAAAAALGISSAAANLSRLASE